MSSPKSDASAPESRLITFDSERKGAKLTMDYTDRKVTTYVLAETELESLQQSSLLMNVGVFVFTGAAAFAVGLYKDVLIQGGAPAAIEPALGLVYLLCAIASAAGAVLFGWQMLRRQSQVKKIKK